MEPIYLAWYHRCLMMTYYLVFKQTNKKQIRNLLKEIYSNLNTQRSLHKKVLKVYKIFLDTKLKSLIGNHSN